MSTHPALHEDNLRKVMERSLRHVTQVMLGQPATATHPTDVEVTMFGGVGFVGKLNGMVHLGFSDVFAHSAASQILGMTVPEIKAEGFVVLKDVIGEITNMIVGGFKNQLADQGFPCKLTVPVIVRGKQLIIEATAGSTRHTLYFLCNGHTLMVDIQIKVPETHP